LGNGIETPILLKAKGVTEDKTVVIYDNQGEQSAQAADTLKNGV